MIQTLTGLALVTLAVFPAAASAGSGRDAAPPPTRSRPSADEPPGGKADAGLFDLPDLLKHLADRAHAYESVVLKFICIETVHSSNDPSSDRRYDYMYVAEEQQRYVPYRQKHTGQPGRGVQETSVDLNFPDSYSWTLMFMPERQQLFHFRYVGQEWFSLRLAYMLEFTEPLPFTSGRTIYEWSGRVWVDAENYNILKVEAQPGNQDERLKAELKEYRQAPRFLIFPMGRRPRGASYNITFLNEFRGLSLPDQAEYRKFTLDLDGQQEWEGQTTLRYAGYQFYDVDVRDKYLK